MAALLSCPFCRELYAKGEATRCPHCDLPLVDAAKLPPSADARALDPEPEPESPLDVRRSFWFWKRGRGLGLLLAALGLAAFFAPWITLARPEPVELSGFDLARSGVAYLWGGAIGWFLSVPVLFSRRTIAELRGVRVILFTFAAMTAIECAWIFVQPPRDYGYFSARLGHTWGLYGSFLLSLLGAALAIRMGGSATDLRDIGVARVLRQPGDAVH